MARKTKKQQETQSQVEQRLTGSGPVRLDASAVKSGGSRGSTASVSEIHPSLEGATQRMSESGLQGGTVTTNSGLSVRVARPKSGGGGYSPQSPEMGNAGAPALQEGVSPRFEQRIGREHGPEAAAKHVAEAEKIAAQPNPLRSDGLVDAVMSLHSPSVGGNRLGRGGSMSALAKMDDQFKPSSKVARQPAPADGPSVLKQDAYATSGKDLALHTLGYTPDIQQKMLGQARDRISRRASNSQFPLSSTDVSARAYSQVNEHLDEAIHGTRNVGHEGAQIREVLAGEGTGIQTAGPSGAPAPTAAKKGGGLGMTKSRTPNQRAMRDTAASLVRGGKWNGLKDADALSAATKQDMDVITAKQKARRAGGKGGEEYNNYSPGADIDASTRRHAQPVFSTSNPGVGVPSEGSGSNVLPPRQRAGAVSPIPSNLPSQPAKIGRSREDRGLGASSFPTGSEPVVKPKAGTVPPKKKAVPEGGSGIGDWSPSSNVSVAQTAPPPFAGTGIREGLVSSRQQNVSLGQRGAAGPRQSYKPIR